MTKVLQTWCMTKRITSRKVLPSSRTNLVSAYCYSKQKRESHTTVDDVEIQLFSTLKDWWNPQGPMKTLHSMNTIRIPFIRDGLVESSDAITMTPLKDKKILDVGCGGGILSEGLARLGANVTGIDATKEMIAIALEHRNIDPKIVNNKPDYHLSTIEEHAPRFKNHYDGVVASEVIEHINNKEIFIKSCTEVLKPGGRIFFTTPNRTRVSQLATICIAEYLLNITPKGTHHYNKFITPNELTFLLERNDCHVEAIYGTFYHFLSNTWEFVTPQHLMYALQAVKLE